LISKINLFEICKEGEKPNTLMAYYRYKYPAGNNEAKTTIKI